MKYNTIIILLLFIIYIINFRYNHHYDKEYYNHTSQYPELYMDNCFDGDKSECLNSLCIYKTLEDAQNSCPTGASYCPGGKYSCNLQHI